MSDLGDAYEKIMNLAEIRNGGDAIPEDGVCWKCGRLVRNHEGVERVLAFRRLKYYDVGKGQMVQKTGIPYCVCTGRES